jgi:benzodiazapine receptor
MYHFSDVLFLTIPIVIGIGLPALVGTISKKKNRTPCGTKPKIQPPGWVFGVVWSILYMLLGVSGYFVWRDSDRDLQNTAIILFIVLNISLNAWWLIFSNVCASIASFVTIIIILLQTAATVFIFFKNGFNISGWTTTPLVLWLMFASTLSYLSI